jgi:ribosomal protein S18 acetylase RimI-like enzyme
VIKIEKVRSRRQVAETARLARKIWVEHYVPIIGRAQVAYMLAKFQSPAAIARQLAGGYEYYLAIRAGKPLGYCAVRCAPDKGALLLSKIYVEKAARGLGIGRKLLEFVEELARQRQVKTIWLTVNKHNRDSIAWYHRRGFVNVEPIVQAIGGGFVMDDFRLQKCIGRSRRRGQHE